MTPPIILIDNPDDPRVAAFREVRERDVAGRRNGFIAEGEVVLNVLARSRLYRAEALLLAEKRVDRLSSLIAGFGDDTLVYAASQTVMDAVAGFPIHRGILAFGSRPPPPTAADLLSALGGDALVLALFGISNHDNVGGIFRNAAAFGVDAVLLDRACCDPLYRKAIRVSVGRRADRAVREDRRGKDAVEILEKLGFEVVALSPAGRERVVRLRGDRPARCSSRRGRNRAVQRCSRSRPDDRHTHVRRV